MNRSQSIRKFVCHGRKVLRIAKDYGWLPGARYTNLRDVREFDRLGFLDIDWKNYCFKRHLVAAKSTRPMVTVARDIIHPSDVKRVCEEADELSLYADQVIVVPKAIELAESIEDIVPKRFDFGYSVPSIYGSTRISTRHFKRRVHLLGGRPDVQRVLAGRMLVSSFDCNRFTFDAAYGDFFDGHYFRPLSAGGYEACIRASLENINRIWVDPGAHYELRCKRSPHDPRQLRFDLCDRQ